jgi:hypothetical protein
MKKVIIFCFAATLFVSCKKDKQSNPPSQVCKQDMAGISGTYKNTAVAYKASPTAVEQDYYTAFYPDACERDDLYILQPNGTYTYSDAGTQCSPSGSYTGTWSANGNAGTYSTPFGTFAVTIQSFNCTTLVLLLLDFSGTGSGDQLKLTFTRQ